MLFLEEKKIMKLLIQSPGKFVLVIQNLVTKINPKFVTLRLYFKIS